METRIHISLYRLILSLSDSLNYFHPQISDHQQRVTYIAMKLAKKMGFQNKPLSDIFLAAALHDIGLVRAKHIVAAEGYGSGRGRWGDPPWNCEIGYELLRDNPIFSKAAEIIRFKNRKWNDGDGADHGGNALSCQILALADFIDRSIDGRVNILEQAPRIVANIHRRSGDVFSPRCIEAFEDVASTEAFWMDCISKRIYSLVHDLLLKAVEEHQVGWTNGNISGIAEIFAHIVDSMSEWTATHTAGVAATSVELVKLMRFPPIEQQFMRTAGLLHDLGKLSVPARILDKQGELTYEDWLKIKGHSYHTFRILETVGFPQQITEWASFHHERIDGKGYPFHIKGEQLSLGSRIMAVADSFTALTEDRPYRKGMEISRAIATLKKDVNSGGLDGDVMDVLLRNLERIDSVRRDEQSRYARSQERIDSIINRSAALTA